MDMSVICGQLLSFIVGHMTPVMQLTDAAVAFSFKQYLEVVKAEVRRKKREGRDIEDTVFSNAGPEGTRCDARDLLRICASAWRRRVEHDEVQEPDHLLKAARSAGWLSHQADPERKVLVRCDEQHWMAGRQEEFPE